MYLSPGRMLARPAAAFPVLDLMFLGAAALDSRVTFTRTTTATYFDSSGTLTTAPSGAARLDYDPLTLQPRGLLIEEARVNLLQWSNDLSQASVWTKTVGVTLGAPATVAGITLSRVQFNTAGFQNISQNIAVSATTAYTVSAVFQVGSGADKVGIHIDDRTTPANAIDCQFDVTGSTIALTSSYLATVGFTGLSAYGVSLGNGLYRLVVMFTTPTGCTSIGTLFEAKYSGTATTGSTYIGACQSEQGTFPTSIIPTVGATATRNADVATITTSAVAFNTAQGTLVADSIKGNNALASRILTLDDGTANQQIRFSTSVGVNILPLWQVIDGGVVQCNVTDLPMVAAGAALRIAGRWGTNDFAAALNGVLGTADVAGSVPAVTTMHLGANEQSTSQLNGWIRRVRYFAKRIPDAMLKALTA